MFYPGTRQPGLGQYHLATSTIEFSNCEVSHKPHGDRARTPRDDAGTAKPVRGPCPFPRARTGGRSGGSGCRRIDPLEAELLPNEVDP